MRALAFFLLFAPLCGQADINLYARPLNEEEKASVLKLAKQTCDQSAIEVDGFASTPPNEKLWEADARVYVAPIKSKADICKSRVCAFEGSKPNSKGKKAPGRFAWRSLRVSEVYQVWPAEGGECRGRPSSKIALVYPVEENTLRSLLDQRSALAEQGREWIRKNNPDSTLVLDGQVGELELIEVSDWFGTIIYRLDYAGVRGLSVFMSTGAGRFVVEEAGPAPRP